MDKATTLRHQTLLLILLLLLLLLLASLSDLPRHERTIVTSVMLFIPR